MFFFQNQLVIFGNGRITSIITGCTNGNKHMWFMHTGALAHVTCIKAIFGHLTRSMDRTKWTDLWPSGLSDLTLADFYLWDPPECMLPSERVNMQTKLNI